MLVAIALVIASARTSAAEPVSPDVAVAWAVERSPAVATAAAALDLARGQRAASRTLLYNPQANTQFDVNPERSFVVLQAYQPFSLTGEGWYARAAAKDAVTSAEAALARARFEAAAAARQAWVDAASAQQRAGVAEQVADLSGKLVEAMRRRVEAGDAAELDLRLVQLARIESEVTAIELRAEASTALATLADLVREPLTADQIQGDPLLAAPLATRQPDAERSDVVAARAALEQADAELGRARAAAIPPFWLGVDYEADDQGYVVGPYLQWDFPVFDRNQVGRGDAHGRQREAQARVASTDARRAVEQQTARDRVARAERALPMSTVEAQGLAEDALRQVLAGFEAGEFDLPATIALRRQVLAGLDAILRLRRAVATARIDLLLAVEDPALLGEAAP